MSAFVRSLARPVSAGDLAAAIPGSAVDGESARLARGIGSLAAESADVLAFWKQSSGHRTNLLRPNVSAIGVAMAKNKSGRAYWTLVLGGQ